MSEIVQFTGRYTDYIAGGLQKMASSAMSSIASVKGGLASLSGSSRNTTSSIDTLNGRLDNLRKTRDLSIDTRQIKQANRDIDVLERKIDRMQNSGRRNSGGGGMGMLGGLVAGAGLVMGLGSVATAGLNAQAQGKSMEVLAGEKEGKQLFGELTKFANDSIFGAEVNQHAQTLMGFGEAAKNVMGDIRMLGDVSMGNKDRLAGLTLAFSNTLAAGKLTGQDMIQYINAGFNPLNEIARTTGKSMGVLKDEMSKGLITFDMVKGAFQSATGEGGKFHDMTNKIAATDFGKVEAFKGQLSGLAMQFGGVLAPIIGNFITNYLAPFAGWIGKNQDLVVGLGTALLAGVGAYKVITIAQGLLNVVMSLNPIGLIVAGIAALTAGFIYAYNKVEWFRGGIMGAFESLKAFGSMVKDVVIERIKSLLTGIAGIGKALMEFFKGNWSNAFDAGKQAISDLVGVSTARKAMEGAKKVGEAWKTGYAKGVAGIKDKASQEDKAASGGLDAFAAATGDATASGAGAMAAAGGGSVGATGTGGNKAPSQIIIQKVIETINIHGSNFKESVDDMERQLEEAVIRVLKGAGIAIG